MYTNPLRTIFFMSSTVKFFEIFPKHNRYSLISESFVLNWWIYTPLLWKNCWLHCNMDLDNFFLNVVILIINLASAVIIYALIHFSEFHQASGYLFSYYQYALINRCPHKNNQIFFTKPSLKKLKVHQMPWLLYQYISGSTFLVNITAPNRQALSLNFCIWIF